MTHLRPIGRRRLGASVLLLILTATGFVFIASSEESPDSKWVDETAGSNLEEGVQVQTSGGLSSDWTQRPYKKENLWVYQPLKKPAVPLAKNRASSNPIDAFIIQRLEELDLKPAPLADRRTLIRRVTFDLLGLPPTPEEVDAFVKDPSPDTEAFAKLIERLLASPHYGEKWARHWLDVVRYADSSGLANDFERPNAWRYRDYVIRAFNEDKPYDRFIKEQIAGDEIDPENPEMLVAVGFLRMGAWELTGMEVEKIARQRFLDDVTETVGQVFLSHPLQCARCHDHKFDPVPTRDYYRIQAVFATTQLTDRVAPFLPVENTQGFEEREVLEEKIAYYENLLNAIRQKEQKAARQWYAERGLEYVPRNKALKDGIPEDKIAPRHIGLNAKDLGLERIARKNLSRFRWELDRYEPVALSVYSGKTPTLRNVNSRMSMPEEPLDGTLEETAILAGGDPFSPSIPVTPGVLSVFSGSNGSLEEISSIPTSIENRRKALAEWMAHPENPGPARTMVNRVWLWHFGQGIAGNPNNFGATGEKPTHPELLDWLAVIFRENGWSIKSMHRLILMSETYRRSAEHPDPAELAMKDPEGTTYAVFKPRRLTAEELRDSMLALSGELNRELGGIPVRPEINQEVALQPRQIMGTYAPAYQPSPLPQQRHRRSIYALRLRGLPDPFMEVFNAPNPDQSCEVRETSTITPQVLSLFNSEQVYARALAMATQLLKDEKNRSETIQRAFQLVYGRDPESTETELCLKHWGEMTARHQQLKFEPLVHPKKIVRKVVDENTGEKFEFVEKLETYESFVADLHPSTAAAETRGLAEVCLVLLNSNEFVYIY